jgi:hypothetical protein
MFLHSNLEDKKFPSWPNNSNSNHLFSRDYMCRHLIQDKSCAGISANTLWGVLVLVFETGSPWAAYASNL